jgi:hypothetical protein
MIGALQLSLLAPRVQSFASATSSSQKIFQTIHRIPSIDNMDPTGEKPSDLKGNIEFKDVSFIYPSRPESGNPSFEF